MPSIKHEDLSNNSDQNISLDSSTIESAPLESNQPNLEPKEESTTKQLPEVKINSPRNITILATILVALLALVIGAVQVFAPSFLKPTNILFGNKSAKFSSSQSNSASSLTTKSSSSSSAYSFNSSQSDFNISEFYAQSSQSSRSQSSKSFSSQNSVLISSSSASSATQVVSKAVSNEVMPVIGRSSVIPNQVNCNDNNPKTNSKLVCILNFASPIQTGDLTDPELILNGINKDYTQFQKIGCSLNREDSTYSSLSCSTDNLTIKEGDYSLTFGNGVLGAGGYQQKLSQTLVVK